MWKGGRVMKLLLAFCIDILIMGGVYDIVTKKVFPDEKGIARICKTIMGLILGGMCIVMLLGYATASEQSFVGLVTGLFTNLTVVPAAVMDECMDVIGPEAAKYHWNSRLSSLLGMLVSFSWLLTPAITGFLSVDWDADDKPIWGTIVFVFIALLLMLGITIAVTLTMGIIYVAWGVSEFIGVSSSFLPVLFLLIGVVCSVVESLFLNSKVITFIIRE